MTPESSSQLTLYSLAIAAENLFIDPKLGPLKELPVTPIETFGYLDGELKANPTDDTVTSLDSSGSQSSVKVTTDNTITATWFPFHSNRLSPPTIRRGERVLLFRYSNTDKYLWTELGLDPHLRAGEVAQYAWNATPAEGGAAPSKDVSYFLEVNTLTGKVTFSTSKANQEKTSFTVQLNPMDGKLVVMDDIGQAFYIDSMNHVVHLVNADKTEVTLNRQDVTIHCDDTLTIEAGKAINITTKNFTLQAESVNVSASNQWTVQSPQATINSPTITLGSVTIKNGAVTCSSLTSSGKITTNGLSSSLPISAPNV